MDFFASKVAMSICALLVAVILASVMNIGRFSDAYGEIDAVLHEFCSLAERAEASGAEGDSLWTVPGLSSGKYLTITVERHSVSCTCGSRTRATEPPFTLHTWRWEGIGLNTSLLEELDSSAEPLCASSGIVISLTTAYVLVDNEPRLLVFASAVP